MHVTTPLGTNESPKSIESFPKKTMELSPAIPSGANQDLEETLA